MSTLTLTLTKSHTTPDENNTQYRLDILTEATSSSSGSSDDADIIDTLLVIRRGVGTNTQPTEQAFDQFFGIARMVDLSTFGIDDPKTGELFYLTDSWTLIFGHPDTREEAITALKADLTKLGEEIKSFGDPEVESEEVFEVDY